MSTPATPPLPEPSQSENKWKEVTDALSKRFDALKKEMEDALNKFAEGATKLQENVKALADAQIVTNNNVKIVTDEVRVIGGKLPKLADPTPDVKEVKSELGLTLFDVFD